MQQPSVQQPDQDPCLGTGDRPRDTNTQGACEPGRKICFSPDGRFLAALAGNWQLGIWELRTGKIQHVFEAPKGPFVDSAGLAFSHDGQRFACSAGRETKLWDVASCRELHSWPLPPGLQDTLAFTREGKLLLFRFETRDSKLAPWEVTSREQPPVCRLRNLLQTEPPKLLAEITDFNSRVRSIAPSADGSFFAVEGDGGPAGEKMTIKAFDGSTGKEVWSLPWAKTNELGLGQIDPSGKALTFANGFNTKSHIHVEIPSGKLLGTFAQVSALSPGSKYATWSDGKPTGVHLIHPQEKHPLVTLSIDAEVFCHQRFSPSGQHLAWGNVDGSVTVCEIDGIRSRLAELGLDW
jgi:WD40 repeat protein